MKQTHEKKRADDMDALKAELREYQRENTFFDLLISSLPGLFYLFDSDLYLHKWNKNVEIVTGYSELDVRSKHLLELFEDDALFLITEGIKKGFSEGEVSIEAPLTTREGRKIPYFWTAASTTIDGKQYMLGMGIDISQRKQAESALMESEALYRIFAERMTEGVILCHNFKIMFANKAYTTMAGYDEPAGLVDINVLDMVAEGFEVYFREMLEAVQAGLAGERFFQARWRTRAKREIWIEGRAVHIQWKGQPAVLMTARDITEAKLKEISLQEETENLRRENINLRSSIKDRYRLGGIVGKSKSMQAVYERIYSASSSNANVVIYGESGTGKELVARAVHDMSRRSGKPFIAVNCSAIPENLLESEFFGHKKGSFTGAYSDSPGYLDQADGGTLFLDEVGDITPALQAKLLRALEGSGYSPVGSSVVKHSDFRVLSATNQSLREQIRAGKMREDFFYRVHVIPIHLPPLRERKEDIPLLVDHFLGIYANEKGLKEVGGKVMEQLIQYDYPGNVRELQNIIQRYLAMRTIDFIVSNNGADNHVANNNGEAACDSGPNGSVENGDAAVEAGQDLQSSMDNVEREMIRKTLAAHGNNKGRTAEALGVSRKTLFRKIKRLNL